MSLKYQFLALIAIVLSSCTSSGKLQAPSETAPIQSNDITASTANPAPIDSLFEGTQYLGEKGAKAIRLGPNVNTVHSDFAPYRYADRLYFSSVFFGEKGVKPTTHVFSSIAANAASNWSENSNDPGIHTAHISFSANGQKVYFTFCKEQAQGSGQAYEIYTRERAYQGHWLPLKRLPKSINLEGYTSTHPNISYNQSLKKDVLYFASDRPGGMGGMDIWCSPIESNGTYGKPYPLPFNSPGDEVSPFFHQSSQVLYFSSKTTDSENGLDIFKSVNTGTNSGESIWSAPERLPAPFNSQFDDLYFTCHNASGKAYFSSNRPGCQHPDPLLGCIGYDIFEADMPTVLNALVLNSLGKKELDGAKVKLTEIGNGHQIQENETVVTGRRSYFVQPGKKYRLEVEEPGFFSESSEVKITAANAFSTIVQTVYLRPKAQLLVQTFSALDSLPLGGVSFRYSTAEKVQSDAFQNAEDATSHSFLIGYGEKLLLEASKKGHSPAVLDFEAPDAGPSVDQFERMYLQPFTSLPLSLYFDNDQPRWVNSQDTETKLSYDQLLRQYLERKAVFVEKNADSLATSSTGSARLEILAFFENEVQANFEQLDELFTQVEGYLKKGYRLEIQTTGEASPLASPDYNQRLAARRVSSLRNYLKTWKNGALRSYVYSGTLTVNSDFQNAEVTAETQPAILNRRVVEFSPESSRLRKVIIKGIRLQAPKA